MKSKLLETWVLSFISYCHSQRVVSTLSGKVAGPALASLSAHLPSQAWFRSWAHRSVCIHSTHIRWPIFDRPCLDVKEAAKTLNLSTYLSLKSCFIIKGIQGAWMVEDNQPCLLFVRCGPRSGVGWELKVSNLHLGSINPQSFPRGGLLILPRHPSSSPSC